MRIHALLGTALFFLATACAHAIDLREVEQKLAADGAEGEVHGASASQGLYVFVYRNPKDFFDFLEMSMVPASQDVVRQLEALRRHDRVRIKGSFLENRSPQKHIEVTSLEMVRKYAPPVEMPAYEHEAKVPDELLGQSSALFLVHAIHADGQILVVEYKDTVLPIFVKNGALAKNLYRNDLVRLKFKVQRRPDRPAHLRLDETAEKPVEVVESILAKHGQPATLEGALVLFPKSPEVIFNVFAVLEELPAGLKRQYTLVNFTSPEVFKQIREKLQAAWDQAPKDYVNGRNKLVSTKIRVKVTGTFNEVDANQANAQVLLAGPEAIEVLVK